MSTGRLILAMVVVFVLSMGLGYLVHGVLLAADYATVPQIFRPVAEMQQRFPFVILANVLIAIAMVLIYARGVEKKPWFGQGLRFGFLIWLVSAAPNYIVGYYISPITATVLVKQLIFQLVVALIDGVVLAAIVRE